MLHVHVRQPASGPCLTRTLKLSLLSWVDALAIWYCGVTVTHLPLLEVVLWDFRDPENLETVNIFLSAAAKCYSVLDPVLLL